MAPRTKIPTKSELVQLQKLYKTDEKIGERLGGVPAYLVAYWRRKKNVPKYSLPKFSDREILTLWERYGDDEKCGMELGISKAAFYNWRRRYDIREKPAFLKLEQLELIFPGSRISSLSNSLYGEQTIVQKILTRAAGEDSVKVGSKVKVEPDLVAVNIGSGEVISEFSKISQGYVWNVGKIILNESYRHKDSRDNGLSSGEFIRRQGLKTVYDLREGNYSQVLLEKGHLIPGQFILGSEKGVIAYGCVGAFAIPVSPEEAARAWADGEIEIEVPATIQVELNGRRSRGVSARDIASAVVAVLEKNVCTGKVIEFNGLAVSQLSVSERFTLCYMTQLLAARAAICPHNSTVRRYLTGRTSTGFAPIQPDKNAIYEKTVELNISEIRPVIYSLKEEIELKTAQELEGQTVRQVILGTCANGRFEDLRVAADVLKGNTVHRDCRLFICPASRSVYLEALKKGLIRMFVESGAIVMNPGSEVAMVHDSSLFSDSETTLTNSIERVLGDNVYYCSPATAAASALNAAITDPARYVKR
ncbi:MAG: hypothetical protein IIA17_04275 [candidate division Zixibacteria bacterium]|nr:hypothetical protein [candidate division Zixibacteria bacterium]